jgi:hypothetical protein
METVVRISQPVMVLQQILHLYEAEKLSNKNVKLSYAIALFHYINLGVEKIHPFITSAVRSGK